MKDDALDCLDKIEDMRGELKVDYTYGIIWMADIMHEFA